MEDIIIKKVWLCIIAGVLPTLLLVGIGRALYVLIKESIHDDADTRFMIYGLAAIAGLVALGATSTYLYLLFRYLLS